MGPAEKDIDGNPPVADTAPASVDKGSCVSQAPAKEVATGRMHPMELHVPNVERRTRVPEGRRAYDRGAGQQPATVGAERA